MTLRESENSYSREVSIQEQQKIAEESNKEMHEFWLHAMTPSW